MRRGYLYTLLSFAILVLLASCSATKFVPEGSYLLDEVKISTDNKEVKPSGLRMYVRQNPNAKWFSLIKMQLMYMIFPVAIRVNGTINFSGK